MTQLGLTSELMAKGTVIRVPACTGEGYWVGAPGVFFEPAGKAFYLTYRIRRPRGVQPDRGGEARIARSSDGVHFEDVWSVGKDAFLSPSIERCAIRLGADALWRYWLSYVDPADGRWCVAVLKSRSIDGFDPANVERVFSAGDLDLEGVKDPWIMERDGLFHMVLSVATRTRETTGDSHAAADIYNTGECKSATGLATSTDLDHWKWEGVIFEPGDSGWDAYARRINSVIRKGGRFIGFYDGSANRLENYEEKTGLAETQDLRSWRTLTPDGPALVSLSASGALRYVDALLVADDLFLYYEFAREDGSHDLRVLKTHPGKLLF